MDGLNIRKIEIIVLDLLSEFEREGSKLQSEYDDNAARILEIEENIQNYKENEDVDFQVFSPRRIDNQSEEKINQLNKEKSSIESINKSLFRQIKYYTDKTDKLNEILNIIKEDRSFTIESDNDDVYPEEPENIGVEVRSGWRIIKEELNTPINSVMDSKDNKEILSSLSAVSDKLEKESKSIEENYLRTKEEINSVLTDINSILNNLI